MFSFFAFYLVFFVYLVTFNSSLPLALGKLDWNTIVSIIFADIPVGLVLWFALERGQSSNRKLLDAVEIYQARDYFSHLEVHYCDEWDSAEYPYKHYYVVNSSTKIAYFVENAMEDLIDADMVTASPKHDDLDELNRFFDANGITIDPRMPKGDELSRKKTSSP